MAHDRLHDNVHDKYRYNSIQQNIVETKLTRAMVDFGFTDLESSRHNDFEEHLDGSLNEKEQALNFLVKFRKRLLESKQKIEKNRTSIIMQKLEEEYLVK